MNLNNLESHLLHLSAKLFSVTEYFQCFRITPDKEELFSHEMED